jgi:Kdo2-lipid IVA lauroyltransferase/acyltransferase
MDTLLYVVARSLVAFVQMLPLKLVARIGRAGGGLAYVIDARHRRVAIENLTMCFGKEKSAAEIRAIAKENLKRIGENYACAIKTADMTSEELRPHIEFAGDLTVLSKSAGENRRSVVGAIGHFGNFELYARLGLFCDGLRCATTYRSLRQPALNRLLLSLRERSGCLYFERRTDAAALKEAMHQPGTMLGLLADQHGGRNGLRIPFLGHDCSTNAAPAVFALRYHCPLYTGICYRIGLAHWRIEVGAEIPTHENGEARSVEAIMRDVNAALEQAVRRDPANWFWVHKRWKPVKGARRSAIREAESLKIEDGE